LKEETKDPFETKPIGKILDFMEESLHTNYVAFNEMIDELVNV